jgi:hypothetical protein
MNTNENLMSSISLDGEDVKKDELDDALGFDKSNWPDMADRRWETDIHQHYRTQPYWEK